MTNLRPGQHPDELISAAVSDDLTVLERAQLDEHLAACPACRETMAAWTEQRRLVSGMRHVPVPRDLGARVRARIDAGGLATPWWRRPGLVVGMAAGLATVTAAVMAVVVFGNLSPAPVAQASTAPSVVATQPEASVEPSASEPETPEPVPTPTVNPDAFLGPGELGYFSMTGGSLEAPKLSFVKDATGESIPAAVPAGPPVSAAISPDGEWVAYTTEGGESGANQVWALHLTDGQTVRLGCTYPNPFADRLIWSPDSRFLAYTLAAVDPALASALHCGDAAPGDPATTDAWIFRTDTREHYPETSSGDAYAADMAGQDLEGGTVLLVSHAAEKPWSEALRLPRPLAEGQEPDRIDAVFMPVISPRGLVSAAYWTGTMRQSEDGAWRFVRGGMPQVGSLIERPVPEPEPLFKDLITVGGAGFESGHVAWGPDGDLIAFWGGQWTAAPQGDHYPNPLAVYAGRLTDGGLTQESRLNVPIDAETARTISVAFPPSGVSLVVSVGDTSAGIGDPASAHLYLVPIGNGKAVPVGGTFEPPPWDGPAVYGEQPNPF
jgi:hypothetical protein